MTEMISKLSEPEPSTTSLASVRVKTPRRILHFSDGVLEEYSTDEDEVDEADKDCKCVEVSSIQCEFLCLWSRVVESYACDVVVM